MKIYKLSSGRIREDQIPSNWEFKIEEQTQNSPQFGRVEYFSLWLKTDTGRQMGSILAEKREGNNVWVVTRSGAQHGYGPLMYDKAMRYVSDKGGGLMSHKKATEMGYRDKGVTTDAAQNVWDKYRTDRPDVEETEQGFRFK